MYGGAGRMKTLGMGFRQRHTFRRGLTLSKGRASYKEIQKLDIDFIIFV